MQTISQNKTPVEKEMDNLFHELRLHDATSEEYSILLDRLVQLHKLKADEKPPQVSPDTLILASANLLGIIMILHHERLNIITTKAMSIAPRIR